MSNLLLVGLGGFLGAVSRYLVSGFVYKLLSKSLFPYGTLAVNILGCLIIGFLSGLSESKQIISPELRLFLLVGILGGFTTYSTFGLETFWLLRDKHVIDTFLYVSYHLIICLVAVWLGDIIAKIF